MVANVYTYTGLTDSILKWTNRNDQTFIDQIPVFIALTEQEMFIQLSTLGNEIYVTGTFNSNNPYVPKPANWGKTARFSFIDSSNNVNVLERVSISYQYFYNPSLETPSTIGNPRYYSDKAVGYFYVSPAPTTSFNFEIAYFQKVPSLTTSNQSNFNSRYRYDILLWGCLEKAFSFINSSDWSSYFSNKFKEGIQNYTNYDKDRLADATTNVEME